MKQVLLIVALVLIGTSAQAQTGCPYTSKSMCHKWEVDRKARAYLDQYEEQWVNEQDASIEIEHKLDKCNAFKDAAEAHACNVREGLSAPDTATWPW